MNYADSIASNAVYCNDSAALYNDKIDKSTIHLKNQTLIWASRRQQIKSPNGVLIYQLFSY